MAKSSSETFESALLKLESIIKELENGEIDLDKSIEKYAEATKLVKFCEEKLDSITKTVNMINTGKEGEFTEFKREDMESE